MKSVSLSGSPRENVGKKDATSLRNAGRVPAVLYGGDSQTHFHVAHVPIEKIIFSPDTYVVELDIEGDKSKAIIKDIQFHPVTDNIVHVDFLLLDDKKEVNVNLPVIPEGNAIGVVNGGALLVNFRKLTVRGIPSDIPETINLDVTQLTIGSGIRVGDVEVPKCQILQNPADMVISVKVTRAAMSAAAGEGEEGEEGEEGAEGAAEGEGAEAPAEGGEG
ncbi:MAG: 50S ribosomal protein L25 [Flavobacteriales bacterium]|nr:50S ribosomal protein L25 [Flavobacteriales bacterium]